MSLRPVPARWFEVLLARDDLSDAAEALAHTGQIELEARSLETRMANMPQMHEQLETYSKLAQRYRVYWPEPKERGTSEVREPAARMRHAIECIEQWRQAADPMIVRLEALQKQCAELEQVRDWLATGQLDVMDCSTFCQAGPVLASRLFIMPAKAEIKAFPPSLLVSRQLADDRSYLLVVGSEEDVGQVTSEVRLQKGQVLVLPSWLQGDPDNAATLVTQRVTELEQDVQQLRRELETLSETHELVDVLGTIRQLKWFLENVRELPVTENFGWLCGWTSDLEGGALNVALERAGIRGVVSYPEPPVDRQHPLVMQNPPWARPFEVFAQMLGTPGKDETDPARLLAFIVPLLFGYMFGDVGHGLLLLVSGLLLHKRWQILGILIPCGIASMLFGVLFGSFFGNEQIIPPVWVNPVEHPLPVLLVPLAGGAVLLLLGLALNSIEAWWRGEFAGWFWNDAPIILMYVAIIGSLLFPWAAPLLLLGLGWYFIGVLVTAESHRLHALLLALGRLVESLFQLVINTVSFIRVGAFALAHSGLSLAFTIMAEASDHVVVMILLLVLGNLIVILLEGLVVSIQTTRLVLFEFFIRFLRGTGRILRPLKPPNHTHTSHTRGSS